MLARNSDFATLACCRLALSAASSCAARRCSASSRASSRDVALSCTASSPSSSLFGTLTEPPKRPLESSFSRPCAADSGRISIQEMTKPAASGDPRGKRTEEKKERGGGGEQHRNGGEAAEHHQRALARGAHPVAQADH